MAEAMGYIGIRLVAAAVIAAVLELALHLAGQPFPWWLAFVIGTVAAFVLGLGRDGIDFATDLIDDIFDGIF